MEKLLFTLGLIGVGFLLWSLLQGALLRGAGAILNGVSGAGEGPGAVPDVGLWKSTGIAALAVFVNVLISYFLYSLLPRGESVSLGGSFGYWLLTQVVALPVSVIVVAILSVLLVPAPFGRAATMSVIWSGLFLLAGVLLFLLLALLFSVNGFAMSDLSQGKVTGAARTPVELVAFAVVLLLCEVPVFYASTALAGPEPSLLKTLILPIATAAVWGAAAVGAVVYLTPDWLLLPEHRNALIGLIAGIVFGSLFVQWLAFTFLLPASFFSGALTSIYQFLLRLLLYALLAAVNFVFLSLYQIVRKEVMERSTETTLLGPILDTLAALLT